MDINGLPMNPAARSYPEEFIQTGVSRHRWSEHPGPRPEAAYFLGIRSSRHANLAAQIARQAKGARQPTESFAVVFAAMGITFEEANFFMGELPARDRRYRPKRHVHQPG